MDSFLLSFSVQAVTVEAFQAIAQNWSHPLLTDNAVISDLCDKERRYGGFTMFQNCQKHSQIMYHIDCKIEISKIKDRGFDSGKWLWRMIWGIHNLFSWPWFMLRQQSLDNLSLSQTHCCMVTVQLQLKNVLSCIMHLTPAIEVT